jgi:hypothetical protein
VTRQEYAGAPAFQEPSAERSGQVVDDNTRDDLASARGLLIGAACGLLLWIGVFILVWRAL